MFSIIHIGLVLWLLLSKDDEMKCGMCELLSKHILHKLY